MKMPARKDLLVGAAVAAGLGVAFWLGRYSKPVEVREVVRVETKVETLYAAHATTTSTDKGRVRIVTVTKKEPGGTVYVTKTEDRANDLKLNLDWTGAVESKSASSAEATTTTTSIRPGWSVGVGALWDPGRLSLKPETYTLEVDRRLFGPLWVGVRADSDKRAGAALRVEW